MQANTATANDLFQNVYYVSGVNNQVAGQTTISPLHNYTVNNQYGYLNTSYPFTITYPYGAAGGTNIPLKYTIPITWTTGTGNLNYNWDGYSFFYPLPITEPPKEEPKQEAIEPDPIIEVNDDDLLESLSDEPSSQTTIRDLKLGDRVRFQEKGKMIEGTVIATDIRRQYAEHTLIGWLPTEDDYKAVMGSDTTNNKLAVAKDAYHTHISNIDDYEIVLSLPINRACEILSKPGTPSHLGEIVKVEPKDVGLPSIAMLVGAALLGLFDVSAKAKSAAPIRVAETETTEVEQEMIEEMEKTL